MCAGTLSLTSQFSCAPCFPFCCPDYGVAIALLPRGSWPWGCPGRAHCRDAVVAIRRPGRAGGTSCSRRTPPPCLWSCRGSRCRSLCPPLHATAAGWAGLCPGCGPWAGMAPPAPAALKGEGGRVAAASLPSSLSSLPLPAPPRLSLGPRSAGTRCRWVPAPGRGRAAREEPARCGRRSSARPAGEAARLRSGGAALLPCSARLRALPGCHAGGSFIPAAWPVGCAGGSRGARGWELPAALQVSAVGLG